MGSRIAPGDRVTFRYQVLSEAGVVDASEKPVTIVVGEGRFPPSVEKGLLGKEEGEKISVLVPPEEHYGRYDPRKVQLIPSEKLPPQARPGETVFVQDDFGVLHPARLARRDAFLAVVDLNHPLAGKYLRFDLEILKVEKDEPGASSPGSEERRTES